MFQIIFKRNGGVILLRYCFGSFTSNELTLLTTNDHLSLNGGQESEVQVQRIREAGRRVHRHQR